MAGKTVSQTKLNDKTLFLLNIDHESLSMACRQQLEDGVGIIGKGLIVDGLKWLANLPKKRRTIFWPSVRM